MATDPDSRSKKRRRPVRADDELSGAELISDEDILDAADDEVESSGDQGDEEEIKTGKFEVPEDIVTGHHDDQETDPRGGMQPLSDDAFEEETGEADFGEARRKPDTRSYDDGFNPRALDRDVEEAPEILSGDEFVEAPTDDEAAADFGEDGPVTADLGPAAAAEPEQDEQLDDEVPQDTMAEPVQPPRRSRRRRKRASPYDLDEPTAPAGEEEDPDEFERIEDASGKVEESLEFPDATPPDGAVPPSRPSVQVEGGPMPDDGPTRIEQAFSPGPVSAEDKTLIFGKEGEEGQAEPEPDYPFLVVIQGEEEGREIDLMQDEITIGRGADNDLVFPDIACSRHHAMIERKGDEWVVSDLGSGNGTLVNERRIQQAVLHDGDEIEVGNTILQFNDPVAPLGEEQAGRAGVHTVTSAKPYTAAGGSGLLGDPRRRKLILFGGGGVVGLLLLLFVIKLIAGPAEPEGPTPEELRRQAEERARQTLSKHLEDAKEAVKNKQWEQAGLNIQLALKIDPKNRFALQYRDYIKREAAARMALNSAQSFIEQKAWDSAIAALNTITQESEYAEEARRLKEEIEDKLKSDLLEEGRALLGEDKFHQAVLKFDEVLKKDPDHEEAATLKHKAEEELAKEEARLARLERARKKKRRRKHRRHRPKPKKKHGLTGQALALYKNGEIDKAIDKAGAEDASDQADKLKRFRSLYKRGIGLSSKAGQANEALKVLKQALALDRSISGGSGKYHDELSTKLGNVHFRKGVDAHTRHNYPDAYASYRRSLKYRPGFNLAEQRLQDLEKIAKKLYEEAYVIKSANPERAMKNLNTVLKIVPPKHAYYNRAKRLKTKILGPLGKPPETDDGF